MDAIDELTSWLQTRAYEPGVLLYERLIGKGFLLTMLQAGPDAYNRSVLEGALEKKLAELSELAAQKQASYPEPLTNSLELGKSLMDQRTVLKERLRMHLNSGIITGEQNQAWALEILSIRDQLGVIYANKSFFDSHGFLPDSELPQPDQTPDQLLKRLLSVRTYISRYQKKLCSRQLTDEQQQNFVSLLHTYQSEAHELTRRLNPDSAPTHPQDA